MDAEPLIRKLIKATVSRAYREVTACVFILLFFGTSLGQQRPGSARFDGCLLLLASAALIAGVTLKFTLSDKLLLRHPAHQKTFWHPIFLSQARLLRLVPLWYLAPLCAGILLFSLPAAPTQNTAWLGNLAFVAVAFVVLSWLNRVAAARLVDEARTLEP